MLNRSLILALVLCSEAYSQLSNGTRLPTPVVILPKANYSATGELIFEDLAPGTPGTAIVQAPAAVTTPYTLILPAAMSSGCLGFSPGTGTTWDASIVSCAGGGGTPGGSTYDVQRNVSGAFYGDSDLTYNTAVGPYNQHVFTINAASGAAALDINSNSSGAGATFGVNISGAVYLGSGAGGTALSLNSYASGGSASAQQFLPGGTELFSMAASGYDGVANGSAGGFLLKTGSGWDTSSHEAYIVLSATASGSTATHEVFRMTGNLNISDEPLEAIATPTTAALIIPQGDGFAESGGGFLSDVLGGAYNGFQSPTDGAVLPGYGVFPVAAAQLGGYMDYAEVVYPESGSTPCYDIYGNLATAPNGLTGATYAQYPLYSNTTPYPQYAVVYQGASAYYSRSAGNMGNTPPNATYWADMGGYDPSYGVLQDVIVWNGTSPLQGYIGGIHGTVCATPPLTNPLNGLNVSSYVFARYGFATDVASANAIQLFTGGAQAESYFAGAFYPAGTATNCCGTLSVGAHLGGYLALNPTAGVVGGGSGCTSIASCNNPLIPGEPLTEGELYEESTTNHMAIYDGSNWRELAYFGDNVTFGTVTATAFSSTQTGSGAGNLAFQTSNNCFEVDGQANISIGLTCGGAILNKATTAGYGAPNNAADNVYATLGGFQSTCTTAGNTVFSTFSGTFAVTCAGNVTLNNITINGTCTGSGCGGGASDWSIASTNNLYNNAGIYVIAGGGASAVDDGSHAYLQSTSSASVTGTIQAIATTSTIGFKLASNDFSVDGYGDISGTGFLHMTGGLTGGATTHYLTGGDVGIGTASPAYLLDVNGTINSDQTGSGSGNLAFQTANGNFEVDGQGNISIVGVLALNGASGGLNNTGSAAIDAIQGIGGFHSYTSGGGNCSYFLQASASSLKNCTTGETLWALGTNANGGLLRLSNGSGTGGLDSDGAFIYMQNNGSGGGNIAVQNPLIGNPAFVATNTTNTQAVDVEAGAIEIFGPSLSLYDQIYLDGVHGDVFSLGRTVNTHSPDVPTITGTNCSLVSGSTDVRGIILNSGAVSTVCTVTFGRAWTDAPYCTFGGAGVNGLTYNLPTSTAFPTTTQFVVNANGGASGAGGIYNCGG